MVDLTVEKIVELKTQGWTNRQIARELLGKESRESWVRLQLKKAQANFDEIAGEAAERFMEENRGAKVWVFDIETSPTLGWFFGHYKTNIQTCGIEIFPYMLTFSGKWLDNPAVVSRMLPNYATWEEDIHNDIELVGDLWQYLDKSDIVIAHNSGFDTQWANTRFAFHDMPPVSPYREIDTLKMIKKAFRLNANTLEYACKYFELEKQKLTDHTMSMWIGCCNGDLNCFNQMMEYNDYDILSLEGLYLLARPFAKQHPNMALFYHDEEPTMRCPKCGSIHLHKESGKSAFTQLSEFEVYRCEDCGAVSRDRRNIRTREEMKKILTQALTQ